MLSLVSYIIELKSFYQQIDNIVISGNDVQGKVLQINFSQEALSTFSSSTKIYLKWHHKQLNISGYNVFKCVEIGDKNTNTTSIWQLYWPANLTHEGEVICRIEAVDNTSLITSDDFIVTVLSDPIDEDKFVKTDDYSLFSQAAIAMNQSVEDVKEWLEEVELNGVTDYNYVTNKPTIEGVEISGNKTLADFGFKAVTDEEIEEILTRE